MKAARLQLIFFSFYFTINNFSWAQNLTDTIGEQKTAVILIDLSGGIIPRADFHEIEESFFNGSHSVNHFIRETSYQKTWISGQVFGWYEWSNRDKCELNYDEIFNLIQKDLDLTKYDRFFILNHVDLKMCAGTGFGHSTHGKVQLFTPQGSTFASVSQVQLNYRLVKPQVPFQKLTGISSSVIAHEFGHALGILGHANLYECGEQTISTNESNCNQEAIADMFSIMAGESYYKSTLHMSACHKEDLGWMSSRELKIIEKPKNENSILIDLNNFEKLSANRPSAIKIPLENKIPVVREKEVYISNLFLEFRTPSGFNSRLLNLTQPLDQYYRDITWVDANNKTKPKVDIAGIQIRGGFYKDGHCITSYLFDTKPNSFAFQEKYDYSLYDHLDAFVTKGQTFKEPYNNIDIKVIDIDSEQAKLKIIFN
ncbi:MAG: hypothetical protein KDD58_13260 [Bdellovibrionales bacterium]|nr:hypothetical protein [Bdellovibrionales bacterium]